MQYCHPLFLFVASKFCRIPIPENISIISKTLFFTAQSMNIATKLSGLPSQGISRATMIARHMKHVPMTGEVDWSHA